MGEKLSELLQMIIKETGTEKHEDELKALIFEMVSRSLGTLQDFDD